MNRGEENKKVEYKALSNEEVDKAIQIFKEELEKIKELEHVSKNVKTERDIISVWREKISSSSVPAVIQLGNYIYGIGGIMKSENEIWMDYEVMDMPFVYSSIIDIGIFRDLLYFINHPLNRKIKDKLINGFSDFIYQHYIKGKDVQKQYEEKLKNINSNSNLEKILLMIQCVYADAKTSEELSNFYRQLVKEYNNKILTELEDTWEEEYDAFFLTFRRKGSKKVFQECFIITLFGIFQDMSFCGEVLKDPVYILSENIEKYLDEDIIFKVNLEAKIEKYKFAVDRKDKIYEYIMENEDLEDCEFRNEFQSSSVLKKIFYEVIKNSGYWDDSSKLINKISNYSQKRNVKVEEIIYQLTLLAHGFDMTSIRLPISKLIPEKLLRKLEEDKKGLAGVIKGKEEAAYRKVVEEWILDLEYFMGSFIPLIYAYRLFNQQKVPYKELTERVYNELVNNLDTEKKKRGKFTLGDFVTLFEKYFPEKNDKIIETINALKYLNEYRNKLFHPKDKNGILVVQMKDVEEIYKKLTQVYSFIEENMGFKFYLLKITRSVKDSNGRNYLEAKEYNNHRKIWYLTFEDEEIYDDIDETYPYYVITTTNPVARDPFIIPANFRFELENVRDM